MRLRIPSFDGITTFMLAACSTYLLIAEEPGDWAAATIAILCVVISFRSMVLKDPYVDSAPCWFDAAVDSADVGIPDVDVGAYVALRVAQIETAARERLLRCDRDVDPTIALVRISAAGAVS